MKFKIHKYPIRKFLKILAAVASVLIGLGVRLAGASCARRKLPPALDPATAPTAAVAKVTREDLFKR